MNWDQAAGNWKYWTGRIKEKWGKLSDDELTEVAGHREKMTGLLQSKYGYAKEQIENDLDSFAATIKHQL